MKPMLAEDWVEGKVQFPVAMQPKIDGVRGINLAGRLTGRSLKAHANVHTTAFFSHSALLHFDGELASGYETDAELCRNTTSALNTISGAPYVNWHAFDLAIPGMPFVERHAMLTQRVKSIQSMGYEFSGNLYVVPYYIVQNEQQLLEADDWWLDQGYEGSILRKPDGIYKPGRSTVREGYLLRIKRFIEEDAVVYAVEEGETNLNVATINELGKTERSTHAENMVPNGMVGNLKCRLVKDVVHRGETLFRAGQDITVGAARMTHEMRRHYFINQHEIIGKTIKFKTFPKGVKDKPRFPTFQSFRADSDKAAS